MQQLMKILMVTSEMAPLVKTGGLADVLGALPRALAECGHEVAVALPFYSQIRRDRLQLRLRIPELIVDLPVGRRALSVWSTDLDGVTVLLVDDPALFSRPQLYAEGGREYPDNPLRFAYFNLAVLWTLKGLGWYPDILHGHDWQAAYLTTYLHFAPILRGDADLARMRRIFTIHNLSYQGLYPAHIAAQLGLPAEAMRPDTLEFYGRLNLMKGGLLFSDWLTTVSPTYAREIQTAEFGCGLDGVIRARANRLTGILNGIDPREWSPAVDPLIPARYTADDPAGKAVCKQHLQLCLGLPARADVPLLGIVSRLVDQKGFDLLAAILPDLLRRDLQLAVLGTGQPEYHALFERLAAEYPGRVCLLLCFDNELAHQIEAGADLFLMPSRFEPCGLNQMYSLAYGTLPVVRRTGGLADTITDATPEAIADGIATGFMFGDYTPAALAETIGRALALYEESPDTWRTMMRTAMLQDFSWNRAAGEYESLMLQLLSS